MIRQFHLARETGGSLFTRETGGLVHVGVGVTMPIGQFTSHDAAASALACQRTRCSVTEFVRPLRQARPTRGRH
jgi:hypothetical protein